MQRGAENRGSDIHVEAIEEHANADQHQDAAVEGGNRKAGQSGAGVYGHECFVSARASNARLPFVKASMARRQF